MNPWPAPGEGLVFNAIVESRGGNQEDRQEEPPVKWLGCVQGHLRPVPHECRVVQACTPGSDRRLREASEELQEKVRTASIV